MLVPCCSADPAGRRRAARSRSNYTTSNGTATAGTDYTHDERHAHLRARRDGEDHRRADPRRRAEAVEALHASALSSHERQRDIVDGTGIVTIGASAADRGRRARVSAPPDVVVGEGDGYVDLRRAAVRAGDEPGHGQLRDREQHRERGNVLRQRPPTSSRERHAHVRTGETTKVVRVQLLDCADVEGLVSFRFNLSRPGRTRRSRGRARSSASSTTARRSRRRRLFVRDAVGRREGRLRPRAGAARRPGAARSRRTTSSPSTTRRATARRRAGADYAAVSGTLSFAPGADGEEHRRADRRRAAAKPPQELRGDA